MVEGERISWATWRAGGAQLIMLRDAFPLISERVLGAGWRRLQEAEDDPGARSDVFLLLEAAEEEEARKGGGECR